MEQQLKTINDDLELYLLNLDIDIKNLNIIIKKCEKDIEEIRFEVKEIKRLLQSLINKYKLYNIIL